MIFIYFFYLCVDVNRIRPKLNQMYRKILSLLMLLIASSFMSVAQRSQNINVEHLTVDDGLSHNSVFSIFEDELNMIWVATSNGLNRYDGTSFKTFFPSEETNLVENNIKDICGDMNGHIFVKGYEGLYLYDMRKDRFSLIKGDDVGAICYAADRLWYSEGGKIFEHNVATGESIEWFSLSQVTDELAYINTLAVSDQGVLYVGTIRHGLFIVDGAQSVVKRLNMGEINSITLESGVQRAWICSRGQGLYCVEELGENVVHYEHKEVGDGSLPSNNVRHIKHIDATHYYVATYDGLSLLDSTTGKFVTLRYDDDVNSNMRSIISMCLDSKGLLWLGSFFDGIHYYNRENSYYNRYYVPISDNRQGARSGSYTIDSITEDYNGRKWFATLGIGLLYLDEQQGVLKPFANNHLLSSQHVKSIYADQQTLWVATYDSGINRVDLTSGSVSHISTTLKGPMRGESINYGNIVAIKPYNADTLMLGTDNGLLLLNTQTNKVAPLNFKTPSQNRIQVWDMAHDGDHIWISTSTNLYRYNTNNNVTEMFTRKMIFGSPLKNHIYSIYLDERGTVWFGSLGLGVFRYDRESEQFINYGEAQGLGNGYVTNIYKPNGRDELIVSTTDGLSKLNVSTGLFENFDLDSGFPFGEVHFGVMYLSKNDYIYTFSSNSIIESKYSDLSHETENNNIYFTNISVNNQDITPLNGDGILNESPLYQDDITLKSQQSHIRFTVRSNDYRFRSMSRFEYMLEGFETEFCQLPDDGEIAYTNIQPGNYRLIVRASFKDKNGVVPQAIMTIKVKAHPLRSAVAIIIYCLLTIGLVSYIFSLYTARIRLSASLISELTEREVIEEANQSKFRFFTNVAHEFRTPITLISAQLEQLLERRELSPNIYNMILGAYKSAQRLRYLVNDIIDIRKQEQGFLKLKPRCINFGEYVEHIYSKFESYARSRKIEYLFEGLSHGAACEVDINEFEKVIDNLLSNAFKFTPNGGAITVSVTHDEPSGQIIMKISDNGSGISEADLEHIFERFYHDDHKSGVIGSGIGLSLAQGIVQMHSGQITAQSQLGDGTTFTVSLPLSSKEIEPDWSNTINDQQLKIELSQEKVESLGEELRENKPSYEVKMLIVEDNEGIRNMLRDLFSNMYEVHTAKDGAEAIEMVKELQPDIILSDVLMPNMSGVKMCATLKADKQTSHIPIVLLTARNSEEYIVEGLATGADDYIIKPFSVNILVARCNNLIVSRRRLQQRYQHEQLSVEQLTTNIDDMQLLTTAEQIVARHMSNPEFNALLFASEMGLSRTYLFTKIKGVTGQTPNEFILNIRLKNSLTILKENPTISVNSLAYDCGFNSPSYFIKCFKSAYGKTPKNYKNELMGVESPEEPSKE